jgi:hypothetical protein
MMFKTTAGLAAAVALLAAGAAVPQASAASKAKTAAATTKVHSPASIECSKQADAKGLHGKDRVKFRSECKKTYASEHKSASAPAAPAPAKAQ